MAGKRGLQSHRHSFSTRRPLTLDMANLAKQVDVGSVSGRRMVEREGVEIVKRGVATIYTCYLSLG